MTAAIIGYARVSTEGQDATLQVDALNQAGAIRVFVDVASSARSRPQLEAAIDYLRPGDVLTVWRLDRLGRSVRDLIDQVRTIEERGAGFRSLTEAIDSTTPGGRVMFHIFGALAEFERNLIRERTQAGLSAARARGRKGGRKRKMTDSKIESARKLLASGVPPRDVAKNLGVSVPTLYRWIPASSQA